MTLKFTPEQDAILQATFELIGKSGASGLEIGYEHDDVPMELAGWYCQANWGKQQQRAEGKDPIEAADALAKLILDGGMCLECQRRVTIDDVADTSRCFRARVGDKWLRGCEIDHPAKDGPMPTKRKLAVALLRAGAPSGMIEAANAGYFDEFESDLAFPLISLVEECKKLHAKTGNEALLEVANRTINGDFDATKEESDRYFESDDGKKLMEEFGEEGKAMFERMMKNPPSSQPQNRAERRRAEREAAKRKKK